MSVVFSAGVSTVQLEWLMPLFATSAALLLGTVMLLMSRACLRAARATVQSGRARRRAWIDEPVAMLESEPARRVVRDSGFSASMPSRAPPGRLTPSARRPDLLDHRGNRSRE
jgi:hypothetical protein